jgi:perosamine synthetase
MPISRFQWPEISEESESDVLQQLKRTVSIYDNSDVFGTFEKEFGTLHRRKFALLTNSGTSALASIYWALELPPGSTVVVPAYTFFATFTPLVYKNVRLVFCDCDEFGNISSETLANVLDQSVRAVVITHMWGLPADVIEIKKLCDEVGALLIEDCSHAHGARAGPRIVGSLGHAAAWSLQGSKTITGGEGGILCTDDKDIYYKALLYGHYNRRCVKEIPETYDLHRYCKTGFGLKLRAHPLAIALALGMLRRLDDILDKRNATASSFADGLAGSSSVRHAFGKPGRKSWYTFPITLPSEEMIPRAMEIAARYGAYDVDFPGSTGDVSSLPLFLDLPIERFGLLAQVDWKRSRFEMARSLAARLIKVPVWTMKEEHVTVIRQYVEVLRAIGNACK